MRRWLPTREELRAKPWLAPLAHHFENERLWHTDRGSVARAVAIGLFFGFMIPVAQFLFAIALAIALRANVAIAAAATLVTNPFTFPPIYWAAYKVGGALIDAPDDAAALQLERDTEVLVHEATNVEGLWATLQAAGHRPRGLRRVRRDHRLLRRLVAVAPACRRSRRSWRLTQQYRGAQHAGDQ